MKKIFTLIAMAIMAVGANAQSETLVFTDGATYSAGQELTTSNTKLVLGTGTFKVEPKSHKAYIKESGLSQSIEVDGSMKDRYVLMSGNTNPTTTTLNEENNNVSYNPSSNKVLPSIGTYFAITTNKAGEVLAGIVLNASKSFYIVKASTAEPLATSEITLTNDGVEGTTVSLDESYQVAEKLTGTAKFNVSANETYYVFCNGSKLGFFGYVFTPGTETAIKNVDAAPENGEAYNLAGQKVSKNFKGIMIQNGKKVVIK